LAGCFFAGGGGGGWGFSVLAKGSDLPMDDLDAVLTTAAIDDAVIPFDGAATGNAEEAGALSSLSATVGSWGGMHFF
jgi:hypothetical protein